MKASEVAQLKMGYLGSDERETISLQHGMRLPDITLSRQEKEGLNQSAETKCLNLGAIDTGAVANIKLFISFHKADWCKMVISTIAL